VFAWGLLVAPSVRAFEADPYYAWGRSLRDSTEALNAKFNLEIDRAVARANAGVPDADCGSVAKRVRRALHFGIFHPIEIWAMQSSWVERLPATTEEEFHYRETNLYRNYGFMDTGSWIPNAPILEVDGIRIATDKLAHFASSGWRMRRGYLRGLERGLSHEEAEQRVLLRSVTAEQTILGGLSTGVFSPADLEANYQGMRFFLDLCHGEDPILGHREEGWTRLRPFDIRDYVSPAWDEAWRTPVYTARHWRKVRPVMETYCAKLDLPEVVERKKRYALRDAPTPTGLIISRLVEQGHLPDPSRFSLEAVCADLPPTPSQEDPAPVGPGDPAPPAAVGVAPITPARLAAHEEDRDTRRFGLVGAGWTYPKRLSASFGVLRAEVPADHDCRKICDLRGPFLQVEAGTAGGQLSAGWARLFGERRGHGFLLPHVYLAFGVKGSLLRTWGDSPLDPDPRTLLGIEGEFTITRVNFSLGVFRGVRGNGDADPWVVTSGIGLGF
jgi:hypothetical protein